MILIDPPTPFDTLKTWQRFKDDMVKLVKSDPESDEARYWLIEAEKMVRELSS